MGISYSVDADPDTTAKAMLRERPMSHKHATEIAREIKGMSAGDAVSYLDHVLEVVDGLGGRHPRDLPGEGLAVLEADLTLPEHRFRRRVRVYVD